MTTSPVRYLVVPAAEAADGRRGGRPADRVVGELVGGEATGRTGLIDELARRWTTGRSTG
ncbi:hypothetical protein [Kribbella sp. DT2]|uniref:hypothetical protein n=1 Tax=Kribbella sp. DT2 TaxID=3393427 RepID=UPI003CEC715F